MTSGASTALRSLLVFGLIVPVALLVGYLLATPQSFSSIAGVAMILAALSLPLVIKYHHSLLIIGWHAAVILFFLPGQPEVWVVLSFLSLGVSIVNRAMGKTGPILRVPSVVWPLLVLAAVVLITMQVRGGLGARALGSEAWGGKRYLTVLGAIAGCFALMAQNVPTKQRTWLASLFILSGVTAAFADVAYATGAYALFAIFPSNLAYHQALTEMTLHRYTGLAWAAQAGYAFLMLRYGLRGLFDLRRPYRLGIFLTLVGLSTLGGFRSTVIIFGLVFCAQFYFERLHRTKLLPGLILAGLLVATVVVVFIDRMPLSVQRSVSFLPLDIHPMAKQDAQGTLDWRLEMWKIVLPEVPRYLLLGKGYNFSGVDYYLTQEGMKRGLFRAYESTLVSGNYHNGNLTLIIPFGVFGMLAFVWFCWAGLRVLHRNYRFGDPSLQLVNTYLLSAFVGRVIFYFVFYGQFELDLMVFTGLVGLSIALNGGVAAPSRRTLPIQEGEATEAEARQLYQPASA
jgi:hypothetical protein